MKIYLLIYTLEMHIIRQFYSSIFMLFFLLLTFLFSVKRKVSGGHKWTRTIDLTLIRRAL